MKTQSRTIDPVYVAFACGQMGIGEATFLEFLGLPFAEAVTLAQSVAKGSDVGERFAIRADIPLSLPGEDLPPVKDRVEIRTRKILNERQFQGQLISHFGRIDVDSLEKKVRFNGLHHFQDAVRTGRPVSLLNSHVGPGQLAPLFLARMGYDIAYMGARNLFKIFGLDDYDCIKFLFTDHKFLTNIVANGIYVLNNGRILNITGDGYTGRSGVKRPFLGRQRPVPEGYAYMIVTTKALAVPVFVQIDGQGALSVTFHQALSELPESAPRQEKMNDLIVQYLALLEEYWRKDFGNISDQLAIKHANMPVLGNSMNTAL